ncbi:hypothetical protein D3877_10410 [Azospirillum cavernae]|uniref:Uncharacterized protein n=1 Tax=Azospirillum cavernae TaxID=2320860 RepID=A0A418W4C2_9PROT|nr:hypothetical protein [Azospirillum cavernae]RJF84880.1 hypothetical protein D3877_10410 [Azospirillum cavernae]
MTITWTDAVAKLAARYWNSEPVSAANPGGFDEAVDGSQAGHEVNFPAALEAVGVAAQHVGDTAQAVDAAAATAIAQMAIIQASVAGALAANVPVSETGARLVAAVDAVGARAEIGAASVADVQAALPAGLTYRIDQLNRLAALGAVGVKL